MCACVLVFSGDLTSSSQACPPRDLFCSCAHDIKVDPLLVRGIHSFNGMPFYVICVICFIPSSFLYLQVYLFLFLFSTQVGHDISFILF